tara:strand:- start:7316 stop:7699 length:384 start_codon:yes stop_codon:yes gene_type:complete
MAVPVVPNFTQGSMTSHTETTSTVVETINSMDYSTGWTYSVTGTNVQHDGTSISPDATSNQSNVLNGVTSTWTGLDTSQKPNWNIVESGAAFQFTEHYNGPGLQTQTIIQRETTVTSITDTTSIFSQ